MRGGTASSGPAPAPWRDAFSPMPRHAAPALPQAGTDASAERPRSRPPWHVPVPSPAFRLLPPALSPLPQTRPASRKAAPASPPPPGPEGKHAPPSGDPPAPFSRPPAPANGGTHVPSAPRRTASETWRLSPWNWPAAGAGNLPAAARPPGKTVRMSGPEAPPPFPARGFPRR